MINLGHMKLHAAIKPLVGSTANMLLIVSVLLIVANSYADVKPITVAYAPMQPVIQTEPALPKPRPDPALAYDLQPSKIVLPQARPSLEDILPLSTITLAEMIKMQTGHDTASEFIYKLRAGEGIGAILRRADYSAADTAAAIDAAASKASLVVCKLECHLQLQSTDFGFS